MGAIETCTDSEVDLYVGSGGAPEGVLARALKCLGGEIQGRLIPETPEDFIRCQDMGLKHGGADDGGYGRRRRRIIRGYGRDGWRFPARREVYAGSAGRNAFRHDVLRH